MNSPHSRPAFTLVELLLFTGIISIMAGAIVGFSLVSSNIASRNEIISEVEQNGDVVLQRITRSVGELADAILYPDYGQSANALVLAGGGEEYVFYKHGDRIAFVEDGNVSYLTTGDVIFDNLGFLHYGEQGKAEGVSVVFSAGNSAVGTEVAENQFARVFRGSASLNVSKECVNDAQCSGGDVCCRGFCRDVCNCETDGLPDCAADEVCCITNTSGDGTVDCTSTPLTSCKCYSLSDCPSAGPSCDTANCEMDVPTCDSNDCTVAATDLPCDQCSTCGDGAVDVMMGEECDDDNDVNSDDCTNACQDAECGDGIIWNAGSGTEQCDDGNTENDDGCSSTCLDEDLCVGGTPDGEVEGDEECDDNNLIDTDTCDSNCRITVCGDGTIQNPNGQSVAEECDDGNTVPGDGCSVACQTESDDCGDGNVDVGEDCDDGKRCDNTGDPCQDDLDCSGGSCVGRSGDGCTTPGGGGGGSCGNGTVDPGEECNEPALSCPTNPATTNCNTDTCQCEIPIDNCPTTFFKLTATFTIDDPDCSELDGLQFELAYDETKFNPYYPPGVSGYAWKGSHSYTGVGADNFTMDITLYYANTLGNMDDFTMNLICENITQGMGQSMKDELGELVCTSPPQTTNLSSDFGNECGGCADAVFDIEINW